jgi:hypothetical protein
VFVAILHKAELRPTKLELLTTWLPAQPWFPVGGASDLSRVGAYRFDDPADEVGIETMIVRAGDGPLVQVPLTYRSSPLEGAEQWLIGTSEHSVLGKRWVYDGCGDPVYVTALATAILAGQTQADLFYEVDGRRERKEDPARVAGSGTSGTVVAPVGIAVPSTDGTVTAIKAGEVELRIFRVLGDAVDPAGAQTLTGTWTEGDAPVVLALAS